MSIDGVVVVVAAAVGLSWEESGYSTYVQYVVAGLGWVQQV